MLHKKLVNFFNETDLISKYQFGFQKGHSTSHAITTLYEHLINNLEKQKVTALLFIDLKSAFDTIDPNILIKKLDHYGIRGQMLSVLSSYLNKRSQYSMLKGGYLNQLY